MENASKALIMAGGMLLAILIVSVLIYAWGLYSKYQASRDSLSEIEDTATFNSQFTNYDRDDVLGYELLSLINKVIDYNERKSADDSINGGMDKYPYIHMKIDMGDDNMRKTLTFNDSIKLFRIRNYEENELTARENLVQTGIGTQNASGARASFKQNIENEIKKIKDDIIDDDAKLSLLAKNIRSIFKTESEINSSGKDPTTVKKDMVDKFNNCLGYRKLDKYDDENYNKLILQDKISGPSNSEGKKYYEYACAYYEYMHFKRAIFKCTTLDYDKDTRKST